LYCTDWIPFLSQQIPLDLCDGVHVWRHCGGEFGGVVFDLCGSVGREFCPRAFVLDHRKENPE
jgi:hypothetical protein